MHLTLEDVYAGTPVNNVICKSGSEKGAWVEQATTDIGEWRAVFRSTYFRWALAINGVHVAAERYRDPAWQNLGKTFVVRSLRAAPSGQAQLLHLAEWDGETAAKNHLNTQPMLVAYGIIDIAACFEEWVFDVYRCYLNQHPDSLIRGDDFKDLRRLRKNSAGDEIAANEWSERWQERLDSWQRKRAYDGLDVVFKALFSESGLKRPSHYQHTDIDTWAQSLRLVIVLRNLLIHGVETVTDELEQLSGKSYSLGFAFKKGMPLELELWHLQAVECFADQLLSAVNQSLAEHQDAGA